MKLLFWILVALVAVLLTLFTISNRAAVALALWPLPFEIDLPLYLAILLALLTGFVAGSVVTWIAGRHRRRENRRRGRRIAALERELAAPEAPFPGSGEGARPRLAGHG
jgi:uncharacterized integral membrane protein